MEKEKKRRLDGPTKRPSLSLKKRKTGEVKDKDTTRFSFASSSEIDTYKQKVIPQNTERATVWAVKVFTDWMKARKESGRDMPPRDILLTDQAKVLCEWLCLFFTEVRKSDGKPYCPRSLSSLLSGLHRYIEASSPHKFKIQSDDGEFGPLHTLLENLFRKLHEQGVGAEKTQAEIITSEEEQQLWESGILGSHSPESLLNAVFYYNGLNFTMRGGDEHRSLTLSQLSFGSIPDPDDHCRLIGYVDYTEFGSKNQPGGRKQLNLDNKTVRQYAQHELGNRCHVYLLRLYISKLAPAAIDKDIFYCKPLVMVPDDDSKPWYTAVPIGHNKLNQKLKDIFSKAHLNTDKKSNHSLRATSISRMYRASIPEKVIMERSGHLSKEGLRTYEHTSVQQVKTTCSTLAASVPAPKLPYVGTETLSDFKENDFKQDGEFQPRNDINPGDILKPLNFQAVQGCTFNISLNFKQ